MMMFWVLTLRQMIKKMIKLIRKDTKVKKNKLPYMRILELNLLCHINPVLGMYTM